MKKTQGILCFGLAVMLFLTACLAAQNPPSKALPIKAATSELHFTASETRVPEFLDKNKSFVSGYETDNCHQITPDFVADNSSFAIFKQDASAASFLLYEQEVYGLGAYFGGFGVTSTALADLNQDKQYELYFRTCIHRHPRGFFERNRLMLRWKGLESVSFSVPFRLA